MIIPQLCVKIAFTNVKLVLEIPGIALLVQTIGLVLIMVFALAQMVEILQIRIGAALAALG